MKNGNQFHKKTLDTMTATLISLDQKYGFDIATQIRNIGISGLDSKKEFQSLIEKGVFRESIWLQQMIRNGSITQNTRKTL
jgi:hypothetical protein